MTTAAGFMRSNMLFWLTPIALLLVKLIFDLIPYKLLFFATSIVLFGISVVVLRKRRNDRNFAAIEELEKMEFDEEDDDSKYYGEKNAADRAKKVCISFFGIT